MLGEGGAWRDKLRARVPQMGRSADPLKGLSQPGDLAHSARGQGRRSGLLDKRRLSSVLVSVTVIVSAAESPGVTCCPELSAPDPLGPLDGVRE